MPIKLMLFDLWGTLLTSEDAAADAARTRLRARMVADVLRNAGLPHDEGRIVDAFQPAWSALAAIHAEGLDIPAEDRTVLYVRHFDETLLDRIDDATWPLLHRAVLTPMLQSPPPLIDGATDILREIKRLGLNTGLISNAGITPGFVLREVLARHGVLPHLDNTVFSDEVELSKPAAAIFERALDDFGVAPEEAAFIGDMPILDVLGPQNAGIWSIQYGHLEHAGITPHARVSHLSELPRALANLGLIDVVDPVA